jgi:parallel beta-helix repeat protein
MQFQKRVLFLGGKTEASMCGVHKGCFQNFKRGEGGNSDNRLFEIKYKTVGSRISGNTITNATYDGVYLYLSSGNTVSGNTITKNGYGVYLGSSSGNKFYHNNFINNTHQVINTTPSYANSWDNGYPSGGNYWSDYKGVDVKRGPKQDQPGSDGIGDTPYVIDANNTDRYPLMNPWPCQITPPPSVGGIWVPVDKLALLAPYIALASTILAATAATAIYVKHRKKKQ